ncbi:MAG: glycosyltransferase family 4 protein [Salinivirgaceae bacterium]|nr:glycosyltransferase family 4 protein [Salinivirgaceae bacterium]MDY0280821.1 glycosyltransferase family 4 protein [Salinivirgaceae bacterium]
MKVLMFGWEFPPHIAGGLGTACYGLTKGLAYHGVKTHFVVPKAYGDEDQSQITLHAAEGVEYNETNFNFGQYYEQLNYIEVGSNIIPYLSPEEFEILVSKEIARDTTKKEKILERKFKFAGAYGSNLMLEVSRYAMVASVIARKLDFDVIHAHDWLTYAAGVAAKRATGKPLVVHMHATEYDRSGDNVNPHVYNIERMGMSEADLVITVSNFTRQIVINKYGIDPNKVMTVHNAVEPDEKEIGQINKNLPEKIVTFLGRVTYQKGPEYFVESAVKVLQKDPNVRFVMAGSGDMLNRIILQVATLGIADKFHFTGFLKGAEVTKMFTQSDVYVMPSVSEPFGISPLEAMRSNVPVIISKQSGVSEVLKHAVKVDYWDTDAMADAIYGLLQYKSLSKMFKILGKDEVDNLKWDNSAAKVIKVYEEAILRTKK